MIEFEKYAQIKNRYCLCYFGTSDEYILQLWLYKPIIEHKYPGLQLFLGCRDEAANLINDEKYILRLSDLKSRRLDFGHIREISFDGKNHPIEKFINETDLSECVTDEIVEEKTTQCVIITQGSYPTISLKENQIDYLKKMAISQGYSPILNSPIENSGLVMGVESFGLYKAASLGIETQLVPTGLGTNLYRKMFPKGKVLNI